MHAQTSTHILYTPPFPRRVQCVGAIKTRKKGRDGEIDKQQHNFTIPTKIFCRVQESMQETGQQKKKRRRRERMERERARGREKRERRG